MTNEVINRAPLAVMFPGQGGYDGAALRAVYRTYPGVREVFARIDSATQDLFGSRLTDVLLSEPPPELPTLLEDGAWVSQLAIYGAGLAAYSLLTEQGLEPAVLCGHSLGEVVALVAAEAFSVEDGARIVARRAMVIDEIDDVDGRMVAIGADVTRTRHLVELVGDPLVAVASANHDLQTVISGPAGAIEQVLAVAGAARISAIELEAPFPFHTPMLAPAVAPFAEYVSRLDQRPMCRPVLSPILGRYYEPDDSLGELLSRHLVLPVDFAGAIRTLWDRGCRSFVEAGGKAALSRLTARIVGDGRAETLPTLSTRGGVLALTSTMARLKELGFLSAADRADPAETLRVALAPHLPADRFAGFWLAEREALAADLALRFDRWNATATAAPAAQAAPPVDAAPPVGGAPDRAALFEHLSAVYAEALEYPPDVFADDALLEADLGVDSVKQIELLNRVSNDYGLAAPSDAFQLSEVDTLDKIVDFLAGEIARTAGSGSSASETAPPPAEPAPVETPAVAAVAPPVDAAPPVGGAPDRAALFEHLSAVYAEALEYPPDVFADDALLEADLGVDSVKQIELLNRVSNDYGLAAPSDAFQLSEVDTLDKIVDFLAGEIAKNGTEVGSRAA